MTDIHVPEHLRDIMRPLGGAMDLHNLCVALVRTQNPYADHFLDIFVDPEVDQDEAYRELHDIAYAIVSACLVAGVRMASAEVADPKALATADPESQEVADFQCMVQRYARQTRNEFLHLFGRAVSEEPTNRALMLSGQERVS